MQKKEITNNTHNVKEIPKPIEKKEGSLDGLVKLKEERNKKVAGH